MSAMCNGKPRYRRFNAPHLELCFTQNDHKSKYMSAGFIPRNFFFNAHILKTDATFQGLVSLRSFFTSFFHHSSLII